MPLVPRIAQWWPELQSAASLAQCSPIDAWWLGAIMDRETNGGSSRELDVIGPSGTGDFKPRTSHRYSGDARFKISSSTGSTPLYMPADGRGWGRGLMQIDYAFHPQFMAELEPDGTPSWANPAKSIRYAAGQLALHLRTFASSPYPAYCSVAAYNCGAGNVGKALRSVASGTNEADFILALDAFTAEHDYLSDVIARRTSFLSRALTVG